MRNQRRRTHFELDSSFRTRNLAAVILAFLIGVAAFPVAVQAASTIVNIADPVSGSKARVDAGSLRVGGTILARPAGPVTPLFGQVFMTTTNRSDSLAGPFGASNNFFVTNLTFANVGTVTVQARLRTVTPVGTNCSTGTTIVDAIKIVVPAGQTLTIPFPTPLVAAGPCLQVLLFPAPPSGAQLWVTAVGYR